MRTQYTHATDCSTCSAMVAVRPHQIGCVGVCPACGESILVNAIRPLERSDREIAGVISSVSKTGIRSFDSSSGTALGDSTSRFSEGTSIGRYLLKEKLGEGGFGEVWRASDQSLHREVAIKIPRFQQNDIKRQRRFAAEAKASAGLRHPNIVPIFDADEVNGQAYIATEFVRGIPLSKVNENRPAPMTWTIEVIAKLADALHYSHEQAIVHRDIKPDNVLIDRGGEPQLLDFGLAKNIEDDGSQTIDGTVLGTPAYMAPEQARGEIQQIGPQSDQYSLGVVMFRLLTGRTPFTGSPMVVLQQINQGVTPSLGSGPLSFPSDLISICNKARAKNPKDRYSSCGEFASDCRRFLAGLPVAARPLGPLALTVRWARSNRREACLAAACLIVGPLLLAISLIGWSTATKHAAAAAQLETQTREETQRILDLEQRLERRVEEAARARDASDEAKIREQQARQDLEQETERLAAAIRKVEAANKENLESQTALSDEQQIVQDLQSKIVTVKQQVKDAVNHPPPMVQRKSTKEANGPADIKHQVTEPLNTNPNRMPPFNPEAIWVQCYWKGQVVSLRFAGMVRYRTQPIGTYVWRGKAKADTPVISDISYRSDGSSVICWSNRGTTEMGIGTHDNSLGVQTVVPVHHEPQAKLANVKSGAFSSKSISGVAVSENHTYFSFGSGKPNAIIRYDAVQKEFFLLRRIERNCEIDIYGHDPDGLYSIYSNHIERFQISRTYTNIAPPSQTFKIAVQEYKILSAELIESEKLILTVYDSAYGSERMTLLLDLKEKKFKRFKLPLHGIAQTPTGNLVADNGQSLLTLFD
ncbi:serine/threonine protein kinase [Roseimaritima multifibrata]|nr:serine/threonine-protein kinase [Roseimaritima multifibrata]